MGLSEEEKIARKKSEKINWLINHGYVCDKNGSINKEWRDKKGRQNYVFISYKSDDWSEVLEDIIYKACLRYGLRIYFDTTFDSKSAAWVRQFPANMESTFCRGIIAFESPAYHQSYATLMEIMASLATPGEGKKLAVVTIKNVKDSSISDSRDDDNTGLGMAYSSNAGLELELFNSFARTVSRRVDEFDSLYDNIAWNNNRIYDTDSDELHLTVKRCRKLMRILLEGKHRIAYNDSDTIVDALYGFEDFKDTVFDPEMVDEGYIKNGIPTGPGMSVRESVPVIAAPPAEEAENPKPDLAADSGSAVGLLPVGQPVTVSLAQYIKISSDNKYTSKQFKEIRLIGKNGCEKYTCSPVTSGRDLYRAFVNKCADELGMDYIMCIMAACTGKPMISDRKVQEGYSEIRSEKVSGYWVDCKFNDHLFVKLLEKQLDILSNPPAGYEALKEQQLRADNFDISVTLATREKTTRRASKRESKESKSNVIL